MAAAMAESSVVIRENGHLLKDKNGYMDFDPSKFADTLLANAENFGPLPMPIVEMTRVVPCDQTANRAHWVSGWSVDKLYAAAVFIFRAHQARKSPEAERWLKIATGFYKNEYAKASLNDWWRDFGAGGFGKLASLTLAGYFGNSPEGAVYHHGTAALCFDVLPV